MSLARIRLSPSLLIGLATVVCLNLAWPVACQAQGPELAGLLRSQLAKQSLPWAKQTPAWSLLQAFYSPDFQTVWLASKGPNRRARQLLKALQAADTEGLDPQRYHVSIIEQHWKATSRRQRVWLELLLSDALLHYGLDLRHGRFNPAQADPDWRIVGKRPDGVSLLREILSAKNFAAALKALPPPYAGYRRLRDALARYRHLANERNWPVLPEMPKLYWGMWHEQIPVLRRRLILTGDLRPVPSQEAGFFDQGLKQAVERFQERHGLKADGIVGATTRHTLNRPLATYIEKIKLNMERWRWLPRHLGKRYIMVNTVGYQLYVMEHDRPRLAMRVISGTPERPSPVVAGRVQRLILNPYWFIPKTIALEDLIPKQIRNPRFFKVHHIRVLTSIAEDARELDPATIDWTKFNKDNFPYLLRQDPGPTNSLGAIKIPLLDNYAIYLHDTPKRQLFGTSSRALSSGCIRVEEPLQLAQYLLQGKAGWDYDRILATIASGETLNIPLARMIPIYLVYWTAWVGPDNAVYFADDIYERDKPLAECDTKCEAGV